MARDVFCMSIGLTWGISSLHVDSNEDSTTPKATNFGHEISSMDLTNQSVDFSYDKSIHFR